MLVTASFWKKLQNFGEKEFFCFHSIKDLCLMKSMRRKYIFRNILLLATALGMVGSVCAKVVLEDLRCEFMVDPLGINAESPRLS